MICEEILNEGLDLTALSYEIICFNEIGSTQVFAIENAEHLNDKSLIIAEVQTAGIGRMYRKWLSPPGGLWFTVFMRDVLTEKPQLVSLATGVALAKALKRAEGVETTLKWPNDVIYSGKKLAGILVKGGKLGESLWVSIGIGLNANNDIPDELKDTAISLKEILSRDVNRVNLLKQIIKELEVSIKVLSSDPTALIHNYVYYSSTIGREVKVVQLKETLLGKAVGIGKDGELLLDVDGELIRVFEGDVIYLR